MATRTIALVVSVALGATGAVISPIRAAEFAEHEDANAAMDRVKQLASATVDQALALSIKPRKQIVLHFDESMPFIHKYAVMRQSERLRSEGYYALALSGATEDGVRVYVAGKTSDKLLFDRSKILDMAPLSFSYKVYEMLVGKP